MKNQMKWAFFSLFLLIEVFLYILILSNLILPTNISCYLSICFCLLFIILNYEKSIRWFLLFFAMIFTLIADTFLVLLNVSFQELAMCSFSIVQILYAIKIANDLNNKKINIISIIVRFLLVVFLYILTFLILKIEFSFLIFISLFYFVNLFFNFVFACFKFKNNILFCVGLFLFILCDVVIGLQFVCDIFDLSTEHWLYKIVFQPFNLAWLFYLPSQVLIGLSLFFKKQYKFGSNKL